MGCRIAAHSPSRAACKLNCENTRVRDPATGSWKCGFVFANQVYRHCVEVHKANKAKE